MRRGAILAAGAALPFIRAAEAANATMGGAVTVAYAGSLVYSMDSGIGPAFDTDDHGQFRKYSGGSFGLCYEISDQLQSGDLDAGFIYSTDTVNHDITAVELPADKVLREAPNPWA